MYSHCDTEIQENGTWFDASYPGPTCAVMNGKPTGHEQSIRLGTYFGNVVVLAEGLELGIELVDAVLVGLVRQPRDLLRKLRGRFEHTIR